MAGALHGVVALDGPSGTGKTTVARKLAARYNASYLDTGAMYRMITVAVLRANIDLEDADAIAALASASVFELSTVPDRPRAVLNGEDVLAEIRSEQVNQAISAVAAVPAVRTQLVARQREIIEQEIAVVGGIVVEGRDIGTVVAPDAALKVFLTASVDIRAARRSSQDRSANRESTLDEAVASVTRRDYLDSSKATYRTQGAEDAIQLDTSELSLDQVLVALGELANQRGMLSEQAAEVAP